MRMLKLWLFFFLLTNLCISQVHCQNGIVDQIDEFIEEVLSCNDVPGLSLTVIRDGKDFISKGYGVSNINTNEPVTNETLFSVNSVTKAFAGLSTAIAIKNNAGFTWTTPVRDILGDWFYLSDSTRTQHLSLVDAMSHRSGISFNNKMRIAGYSLREFVERLQYLEYPSDFRHEYKYNSIMYSLSEIVIEETMDQEWKEYVRDNIFEPVGMEYTGFMTDLDKLPDVAQGYRVGLDNGELRPVHINTSVAYYETVPSCGGIITNALDMRQWIKFQLNEGTTADGVEILTPEQFRETHIHYNHPTAPSVIRRPNYPVTFAPPAGYSLGWSETTYRDYILQKHGGSLFSFNSDLSILPDVKHGIFISVNRDNSGDTIPFISMFIMDLLLGEEPWLNKDTVCDMLQPGHHTLNVTGHMPSGNGVHKSDRIDAYSARGKHKQKINKMLIEYMGTYGNYAYGNVTIAEGSTTPYILIYGRDNWTYDLEPVSENVYNAIGRDPFWFLRYVVSFDKAPGEVAAAVTISFDLERPPRFERDLDWNNPPLPPELC